MITIIIKLINWPLLLPVNSSPVSSTPKRVSTMPEQVDFNVTAYPNPFATVVNFEFEMPYDSPVRIRDIQSERFTP